MHGAKYTIYLGYSWYIWQQRFLIFFKFFKILLARFIIPFYIKITLIIYKFYIFLIPSFAAALTVHPIFLPILPILFILPPPFSLLFFCFIGKELIFPPFILCRLPHLPVNTLAVISHLPIFLPGVPLLAFMVMVAAF